MKKLLLFLALFAAGVALLLWIERPSRRVRGSPLPPVEVFPPEKPEDAALARPGEAPPGAAASITVRGPVEYLRRVQEGRNQGRKLWVLSAKDSRPLGNDVELFDLTTTFFDAQTGEEVLRLSAENGRGTVTPQGSGPGSFEAQFGEQVVLSGVEATLLRDAPVVPLVLKAPTLVGRLDSGRLTTEDRVEIEGRGLQASGAGLELVLERGLLRFRRDGAALIEVESGRRATLSCTGELLIESPPEADRRIALEAHGDARVELRARESLELEAQVVRLDGRQRRGGAEPFAFDQLLATEDVHLTAANSDFLAERAEIRLAGATGRFDATLSGTPHGRVFLSGDRAAPVDVGGIGAGAVSIAFRGAGPLEVSRREQLSFQLPGPAELEWSGALLSAARSIAGEFGPSEGDARFTAAGQVIIVRPDESLETERFELVHARAEDGGSRLTAAATGPSRLVSDQDPEHTVTLLTEERVDFAMVGETWHVPRALGVDLTIEGPEGVTAHAAEVRDFSAEPLALEALGDVSFRTAEGAGDGERLVLRGLDNAVVEGTSDRPVTFSFRHVEGVARRVERTGDLVVAEGVEHASLLHEEGRFELSCGRLLVAEERRTEADGVRVETVRFTAREDVQARAELTEDTCDVACQQMEGVYTRNLRGEEFLWSAEELTAAGKVRALYRRPESQYEFTSDRLVIERKDRGAEELRSARLQATGNVVAEVRGDSPMRGEGHELTIDKLGRGRLAAKEGERIRAEGTLPGQETPFSGTASWVVFSDSYFSASAPEFDLWVPPAGGEGVAPMHIRAGAQRMELDAADRGVPTLSLTGDVRVANLADPESAWSLAARSASLETRSLSGVMIKGLSAQGDVEFQYGPALRALGDSFAIRAEQRRVRIEGRPARVFQNALEWEGDWFEYDLVVHVLSSGKARLRPRPGGSDQR